MINIDTYNLSKNTNLPIIISYIYNNSYKCLILTFNNFVKVYLFINIKIESRNVL